jgi:hypothetical protein
MLRKAPASEPRPRWVVDKMLFNYRNVGFIHLLFPNAVILHTVRFTPFSQMLKEGCRCETQWIVCLAATSISLTTAYVAFSE